jgi:Copper amine oxidase, enzyme domain
MPAELTVDIRPYGPDPAATQQLAATVVRHPALRRELRGADYRVLSLTAVESERKLVRPRPEDRFRATVYDYTNHRTLVALGSMRDPDQLEVTESGIQPIPNHEEFLAAVEILSRDRQFAAKLRDGQLRPYKPMPPLIVDHEAGGGLERVLAVGLKPPRGGRGHEIVGVNMGRGSAIRFEGGAPGGALAGDTICGRPDAYQSTEKNAAGQAWVTVSQGGTVLWRFLAVRPAASSGTNGSGVELRYVDYRGKRLLYRAHVPILNVMYDGNACGPFLDWQSEEGMIHADGADVAPGFRLCPTPAQTILDTGNDTGNFLGVGIYVQGQEVVLVSEMEAGWYRYVSEWRLAADGTIRPRFGFGAVWSTCVCNVHHHHAYWRLDFDIRTAGNNRVREYNNPPLLPGSFWHTKRFETARPRNPLSQRKWRVENTQTGEAYDVIPGAEDGVATLSPDWPFPQGDVWLTRYRGSEIDNGVVATGPPYEANIANFINGESIEDTDVVVWYAGHATHDVSHEEPGEFGHIVGPELRKVKW